MPELSPQTHTLRLRDVQETDLPIFFEQQLDPDANYMAAFTSKDPTNRTAFDAHWTKNLSNPTSTHQTILYDDQVAGNVFSYQDPELAHPEVSYWLGKTFWGQGIATQALLAFLDYFQTRPLYARVAKDNPASLRVLQKAGFTIISEGKGFANARQQEIEEFLLLLDAS